MASVIDEGMIWWTRDARRAVPTGPDTPPLNIQKEFENQMIVFAHLQLNVAPLKS